MTIRSMITTLTSGFDTKVVSDEYSPAEPIKSKPALQKAEIEWNADIHIPLAPNCEQNAGSKATVPQISNISTAFSIKPVSRTMPPTFGAEIESCIRLRTLSPIFLPENAAIATATVTTPIPPICIISKIIACPNTDQYVAVSCTTRPVTQTAEVAVNAASENDVNLPDADEIGSISKSVPSKITDAKANITICAVDSRLAVCIGFFIYENRFLIKSFLLLYYTFFIRISQPPMQSLYSK